MTITQQSTCIRVCFNSFRGSAHGYLPARIVLSYAAWQESLGKSTSWSRISLLFLIWLLWNIHIYWIFNRHHKDYLITVMWQLMCLFPSIPDTTTTQPTVTFPSVHWRALHFAELDVVRVLNIRTFFVGLLGHDSCHTNLHILIINFRLYTGAPYNFCVVLLYIYMPKSIACSRCLKLHVSTKLT